MIPLFKTHHSIGRSILTAEAQGESIKNGPKSVIDIAVEAKLKQVTIVDDSFSGFWELFTNLKKVNVQLNYGLRLTFVDDINKKDEESFSREAKYVIFARNDEGYKKLIKIYSKAACEGFYYIPRYSFEELHKVWDENLLMAIPMYDSFIYKNNLTFGLCKPDFKNIKPVFFKEHHGLPFDDLLQLKIRKFAGDKYEVVNTHSCYYENDKDFLSYVTYRCINSRTTLSKPNLEQMMSDKFSFESFLRKV